MQSPRPAWTIPWLGDQLDVKKQTLVMDFARIMVDDDLVVYLFSGSLQHGFESFKEFFAEDMFGFIVMMDSTRRETFLEVKSILAALQAYDYDHPPYVVAANKQDLLESWTIEDLQIALRMPLLPVPCIAYDKPSALFVLEKIATAILAEYDC